CPASWVRACSGTMLDMYWVRSMPMAPDCVVLTLAHPARAMPPATAAARSGLRKTVRIPAFMHTSGTFFGSAALPPMTQCVVDEDERQHGLGDGRGAYAHARVVAAQRLHHDGLACPIDRAPLDTDAGRGLDGQRHRTGLAGADAAQYAAGLVAHEPIRGDLVAMLGTALRDTVEPRPHGHPLDGVQPHHDMRDVGVQAI